MFINTQTLQDVTTAVLVGVGLLSMNACQPTAPLSSMGNNVGHTAAAQSSVLKQAEHFWPTATLQNQNLQVAVLPTRAEDKETPEGAVGVQLQLATSAQSETAYRLQANQPGQEAATLAQVMALRVFLVDASLGAPTGNLMPYPSAGNIFTVSTVSASQNILFTQVPTGTYYVCVAAFSNSVAPFATLTNLTTLGSPSSYSEGKAQCSNGGGNGDGSVEVGTAPTYMVSSTTPLNINLNLKSATGASVELSATVTDG